MEEEKILERLKIPWLQQKLHEFEVQIPLQRLIPGGEYGNVVVGDGVFERLQEQRLLDELRELGLMRIEESYED